MSFDDKLKIDPADVKSKIVEFLHSTLDERDIDGLLILYRNCIESITNVRLAIETVGRQNVKVLVTRGRFLNKQPREIMDLESINKYLDLPEENIVFANKEGALREIRKIVDKSFEYKFGLASTLPVVFNYNLSYLLLRELASSEIEKKTFAPPTKKPLSRREKFIQKSIAHYKSQTRLRVLLAFLLAESENRSFIGSTNKTEWLLGLFTKFGTYHAADFLPLACLYRTQVIQLANHLGLQQFLSSKITQSPSSYKYFFNLPYEDVDRILIRFESDFSIKEVFKDTGIPLEAIKKVDYYHKASIYARTVPLIPYI
ncbi:MAG: hypothetical protein ACXADY_08995 [Candidatus Hodarchaeales archaeon]|jgi:NH3-dependent NAD+ synthetase